MGLLLGTGLRVWQCFDWPLGGDEFFTLHNTAVLARGESSGQLTSANWLLSPLMFLMNRPFLEYWGEGAAAIRAVPLAAGLLAPPLLFLMMLPRLGLVAAAVPALLLSLNSWHIEASQFGRYYTTVFLLANVGLWLFYWGVETGSIARILTAQALVLAAILTHLAAVLLLGIEAAYLAIAAWDRGRMAGFRSAEAPVPFAERKATIPAGERLRLLPWRPWWAAAGTVIVMAAGLALAVRLAWQHGEDGEAVVYSLPGMMAGVVVDVGMPVAVLAVAASVYLLGRGDRLALYLVLCIVVPLAGLLVLGWLGHSARPRYMAYAYLPLFTVAGMFLDRLQASPAARPDDRLRRFTFWGVLAAMLATPVPEIVSHFTDGGRYDSRAAVDELSGRIDRGGIVIGPTWETRFYLRRAAGPPVLAPGTGAPLHEVLKLAASGNVVLLPTGWLARHADAITRAPSTPCWVIARLDPAGRIVDDPQGKVQSLLDRRAVVVRRIGRPRLDHQRHFLVLFKISPQPFTGRLGPGTFFGELTHLAGCPWPKTRACPLGLRPVDGCISPGPSLPTDER